MRKGYNKFKGTGVAIVTPFLPSGAVDFPAYGKIIEHIIAGGVEFVVVLGTTGESSTMSKQEKKALVEYTVDNPVRSSIRAIDFIDNDYWM